MKFSIIIPTYNRAAFLKNTIGSAIKQEYRNYEIIVVDDGSTDNTESVVNEIILNNKTTEIRYYKKKNEERGAARNFGARNSTGNIIVFFDSDDELYPNHLKVAYDFIRKNPKALVFHLGYDIRNSKGEIIGHGPLFTKFPNERLMLGNCLSCNSVFLKREIALQNPFSEDRDLSVFEDWELWLRLAAKFDIYYSNEITSSIFNHVDRSVLEVNKEKLILRMEKVLKAVLLNSDIVVGNLNYLNKFKTSCYSYVSLHLALGKKYRKETIKYLFKAFFNYPPFLIQKRFYVIIKRLIWNQLVL